MASRDHLWKVRPTPGSCLHPSPQTLLAPGQVPSGHSTHSPGGTFGRASQYLPALFHLYPWALERDEAQAVGTPWGPEGVVPPRIGAGMAREMCIQHRRWGRHRRRPN